MMSRKLKESRELPRGSNKKVPKFLKKIFEF